MNRDPEGTEITYLKDYVNFDGAKVLEIGCGGGYLTERYVDAAKWVVGLDPNLAILETAKQIQAAQFANAKSGSLPFADETFDIVMYSSSL